MIIKKLTALGLALGVAAVSLTGCGSKAPQTAAVYDGGAIPAGVYIFNQVNAVNEAYQKVENPYADILSQQIDGVGAEQWINDRAVALLKTYVAVAAEAGRLNIAVDETVAAAINQSVTKTWSSEGAEMEELGISLASAQAVANNAQLANLLFEAYYGEGGEKAVSEAELEEYFLGNYRRMLMLVLSKRDISTGIALEGDKLNEQKELYESYKARVESGEAFFDVIVAENDRAKAAAGNTAETPALVEAEQETLVNKGNTAYPEKLLEQIFASTQKNVAEYYEDDDYYVIYELRDTMGDETAFTNAKATLLTSYKSEEFRQDMIIKADAAGFKLNGDVVKNFKISKILNGGLK